MLLFSWLKDPLAQIVVVVVVAIVCCTCSDNDCVVVRLIKNGRILSNHETLD